MSQKDIGVCYILWFFFGTFGVHRLYLGDVFGFALYMIFWLSGGILNLIFWLIDLCLIPSLVNNYNAVSLNQFFLKKFMLVPFYTCFYYYSSSLLYSNTLLMLCMFPVNHNNSINNKEFHKQLFHNNSKFIIHSKLQLINSSLNKPHNKKKNLIDGQCY